MFQESELRRHSPEALSNARATAHKAVQFVTKAARANLPAEPDDSQSNLGWDDRLKAFLSQPLRNSGSTYFVSVSLSPLKLGLFSNDQLIADLDLENVSESHTANWLDTQLEQAGLKPASTIALPYELPSNVAKIETFHSDAGALLGLSTWFELAHGLLTKLAGENHDLNPGPSPIRCWPHHFDIATYVGLEVGDAETAKGIGVGMSPGDDSYNQPYFYINPWPHPNPDNLPGLPAPGHWHTQGFVGAIATSQEILSLNDISGELPLFINGAFALGLEILGV